MFGYLVWYLEKNDNWSNKKKYEKLLFGIKNIDSLFMFFGNYIFWSLHMKENYNKIIKLIIIECYNYFDHITYNTTVNINENQFKWHFISI